jgi:REP element-mobilizing transposase RayT
MKESGDIPAAVPSVLLIHLRWTVANAVAAPLNEEMLARLRSYLPRYAETLSARCLMVGGVHDHLHLLLDLPISRSLQEVEEELRRASQRFLRDVMGNPLFIWAGGDGAYRSVSPLEQEAVVTYISTQAERHASEELWDFLEALPNDSPPHADVNIAHAPSSDDTLPDWLRAAMSHPSK